MVNTYAVQSGGCRFESLWGFGFFLKGAHYEVHYSGKKTYLAGLQCTLTSSCAKMTGDDKGTLWGTFKNFQKKSHSAEKNPREDPLGTSGFVGFLEKVKNERGPFALNFLWPDLALVVVVVSVVRKVDQAG